MRAKANVKICLPSKQAEIMYAALKPETRKPMTCRSTANLTKDDEVLILRIEAKDTIALRAALNSYLRWINSVMTVLQIVEKAN